MASLKDLIVMGPARFLDKLYGNLEGNATSANKWSTPRSFTIGKTARSVDGSINVAWTYNEIGASISNAWGAGTTAGPTLTTTVNGVASTAVAIPSASTSASGIVTTGEQSFTGVKKFASIVYANSGLYIGSNANGDNNFITFYGTTGDGPGSYNHTFIGENLYGGSEGSELVLFKGNDIDNNGGGSPGPDRIRHIAARHVFQTYDTALSGGWTTICDSTTPVTKLEIRPNLIRAYTTTSINTDTADYSLNTNSFICDSWVRTKGNTGWYNETHQGGWYMTDTTWIRAYNDKPVYVANTSNSAIYTSGAVRGTKGFTVDETLAIYPEKDNELNFGGTGTNTTIFMGYRATGSRAIPTKFVFGSSGGTANLQCNTVYLGSGTSSYVSSSQYTGNAASATKADYLVEDESFNLGRHSLQYFNISGTAGNAFKVNDTPTSAWWHIMRCTHANSAGYYTDLAIPFNDVSLYYKRISNGAVKDGGWIKVLDSNNYTSYTVKKDGTGASGNWSINAATATALVSNITFTPAETALTPADVKTLIGGGSQIRKGTWHYAGNGYIANGDTTTSQCPFGVIDLAGTTVIQSTTGTEYMQLFITPPTSNMSNTVKGEMIYYINQGTDYSPTWYRVLTNNNYTSYTVKKDGTGASGNWGINITGNAATATKLATARAINGTNFDGSGAITTANWGTARTITIGNTGKSVNGSGNVSWSLSEIGAMATDGSTYQVSLTCGDNNNTTGYRLIGSASIAAWANRRLSFIIVSRHTGNGLVTISYGCNNSTVSVANDYCSIKYFGVSESTAGSPVASDSFLAYVNSDGTTMYFFWKYHDYNSSYITVLGNSGAFTPSNGTWVTSLSSYGTQIATTQINAADTLSSTLAITKGGTGATTKLNAKTNLGISYGTTLPTSGMSEGDIFFKIG